MSATKQLAAATLAYRNFVDTCRIQATRTSYVKALHYFMDYLQLDKNDYDKLLPPDKDPKLIQMDICDFVSFLRKKGAASLHNHLERNISIVLSNNTIGTSSNLV
jgi:hypothetical protein